MVTRIRWPRVGRLPSSVMDPLGGGKVKYLEISTLAIYDRVGLLSK